jgi:hypothetical protein
MEILPSVIMAFPIGFDRKEIHRKLQTHKIIKYSPPFLKRKHVT